MPTRAAPTRTSEGAASRNPAGAISGARRRRGRRPPSLPGPPARGAFSHVIANTRQTSVLRGTADTLALSLRVLDAASYRCQLGMANVGSSKLLSLADSESPVAPGARVDRAADSSPNASRTGPPALTFRLPVVQCSLVVVTAGPGPCSEAGRCLAVAGPARTYLWQQSLSESAAGRVATALVQVYIAEPGAR